VRPSRSFCHFLLPIKAPQGHQKVAELPLSGLFKFLGPLLVTVYALEVCDHAQIERLAQSLSGESIDLLINNAGIYTTSPAGDFGNADYEAWMRAIRINTLAPLKMVQTFMPQIIRSSQKTTVTISSKMGSIADNTSGGSYIYRSSKAAVNMIVKTLAIDLKSASIISVALHPGWVKTDMGGANALISTTESVTGMRNVISHLALADSGKFIAYDGRIIPW
jgi:NAD(P)-dependent dehydrogenase (short-subunit alcohol dehydrogenase family)